MYNLTRTATLYIMQVHKPSSQGVSINLNKSLIGMGLNQHGNKSECLVIHVLPGDEFNTSATAENRISR